VVAEQAPSLACSPPIAGYFLRAWIFDFPFTVFGESTTSPLLPVTVSALLTVLFVTNVPPEPPVTLRNLLTVLPITLTPPVLPCRVSPLKL
jgi:hypothetical protein